MTVDDRWTAVTALADPSRRALYDYVRRQLHPVTRVEAADAARVSPGLAAFHLDKLVEAGLLLADYQAPPGQPRGRGRAPKVYRAAENGLAVTIPERRYELIAEILADAVAEDPAHADDAARRHARRSGEALGRRLRGTALRDALTGLGFEPGEGPRVVLHNCPFHALALRQAPLVCALNHAFLTALIEGLGLTGTRALLAPSPGVCCVQVASDGGPRPGRAGPSR
jgi:predicted ArsR family transcriptional regulator